MRFTAHLLENIDSIQFWSVILNLIQKIYFPSLFMIDFCYDLKYILCLETYWYAIG